MADRPSSRRARAVIAAAVAALVAAGATVAVAAIPGPDGTIDGCYTKIGGILRVIDKAKGESCNSKLETAINWSRTGPAGAAGAAGAQGPKGDQGEPSATAPGAFVGANGLIQRSGGQLTTSKQGTGPGHYCVQPAGPTLTAAVASAL